MSKKVSCTRGFGIITDPETGTEYNVSGDNTVEVSDEVASRLKANVSGVVVEDTSDICGAEMTDGSVCERPAESCPYHD